MEEVRLFVWEVLKMKTVAAQLKCNKRSQKFMKAVPNILRHENPFLISKVLTSPKCWFWLLFSSVNTKKKK